ncbi:uncharacterized protein LOC108904630 [Anoplophora glabripennis]|uniref:uncharacterized protein LOC108904630 n=1 Tax=Anoplophora glabripennis TaxID=217634 RepID=UPI000873814F|nr:uncharacterized protein LOC108904630 [Anoplophora glabripennis]
MEPGAAIVMDNARRLGKLPRSAWRKAEIIDWLKSKKIECKTILKPELLKITEREKGQYIKYGVDEMASAHEITVLRLPPYYCELNPIECKITHEEINLVTAETWRKCIVDVLVDQLIISLGDDSSSSNEDDSSGDDSDSNRASDQ